MCLGRPLWAEVWVGGVTEVCELSEVSEIQSDSIFVREPELWSGNTASQEAAAPTTRPPNNEKDSGGQGGVGRAMVLWSLSVHPWNQGPGCPPPLRSILKGGGRMVSHTNSRLEVLNPGTDSHKMDSPFQESQPPLPPCFQPQRLRARLHAEWKSQRSHLASELFHFNYRTTFWAWFWCGLSF